MPRMRYFSPDHSKLRNIQARFDGGRLWNGNRESLDGEYLESIIALRTELLDLADGDESLLDLALRWAAQYAVRETAADRGKSPSTISRQARRAVHRIRLAAIAHLARHWFTGRSGFTCSIQTLQHVPKTLDAYVVSLQGHEQAFELLPTRKKIVQWLKRHWRALEDSVRLPDGLHAVHFGGWRAGKERYVLDVSVIVFDFELAIRVARENLQESIYHIAADQTIFV